MLTKLCANPGRFSVFAFARQGDYLYVALTLVVLSLLLASLFLNHWLMTEI